MKLSEVFNAVEIPGTSDANSTTAKGNATSAGLGSEAPHDERSRYTSFARGHNSDTRPDDIELAEEANESEVIIFDRKYYLDAKSGASESPKFPAKSYSSSSSSSSSRLRPSTM